MLLVLFVLYIVQKVVYNLFFHPLSSYPGPKLWAISRLPWHWASINGRLCWTLQEFHLKYGPTIRIAPDELSYTTSSAWKKIYGQKVPEFSKCLDGRGIAPASRNGIRGIVTEFQDRHATLRRAILPAFSDRALREQEHFLQTYTAKLVKQLHHETGTVDIARWFSLTTFDIISELAFGEPGSCLDNADQPWLNVIGNRAKGIVWYQVGAYYGLDRVIQSVAPSYYLKSRKSHMQMCAAKVMKRLKKTDKMSDFMSYIINNEAAPLSNLDLTLMASAFIVAGSGTTASALAGTTFFLLRNPECYQRLVGEIRSSFLAEEDITMAATSELPYLRACVEEGLRMFPPSPSTLPRFVPEKGAFIDGKWIPGGIAVGVHQLSSGLMESNFHRAMEYLPERWLELPNDSPFAKDDRSATQPFSYGPRNCVGKSLGYQEIKLILSKVLWDFDLVLLDDSDAWWTQQKTFLVWEKKPLMVNICPRK
ncbi:cytochrome P450-20 [Coleophoma crateriformis]|uniref:Cytochrome P450-20 n=1 Tax=Coleophoma crateriformis TaxID=565419 RepID=A0A3D8R3I5_9HELO|nr:cytochrome P450-20 [Coleophoma crateriformis]